jgi:hypothetical protein
MVITDANDGEGDTIASMMIIRIRRHGQIIPGLIPVSLTSIIVSVRPTDRPSHLGFKDKCQKDSMGA